MAALIIVAFVLFQHFQYKDASCREKTVGSDDDQHHRQEEIGDSAQGRLDGHRQIIAGSQGDKTHKNEKRQRFFGSRSAV